MSKVIVVSANNKSVDSSQKLFWRSRRVSFTDDGFI